MQAAGVHTARAELSKEGPWSGYLAIGIDAPAYYAAVRAETAGVCATGADLTECAVSWRSCPGSASPPARDTAIGAQPATVQIT